MKIFLLTTILLACALGAAARRKEVAPAPNVYSNSAYHYSISIPSGVDVDDAIPELVSLHASDGRLRINAGCLAMGTENLTSDLEIIMLGGIDAVKENLYAGGRLKMRRYALTYDNKCYSLELVADSEEAWRKMDAMARQFRFD